MATDHARAMLALAARDLVVAISGAESFEPVLDSLARRRTAVYTSPSGIAVGELYWVVLATALAPVAPPGWMPMQGLIAQGVTLEGGAKGLRGLFVREPSEKEKRRVVRAATLAARIMEIVAGSDESITPDERRLVAMAMASFGLTPDELAATRSPVPLKPESLEIFGDVDKGVRRELLRGAWQLALADKIEPSEERVIRTLAARLELSAEADQLRSEVLSAQIRQGEMAAAAVELARGPLRTMPTEAARMWLDHLVTAASPVVRKQELMSVGLSTAPVRMESLPRLDAPRRAQALALALATLLGHDPPTSTALRFRAELGQLAQSMGAGTEIGEAFGSVDRFLFDRVREAQLAALEAPAASAQGATSTRPR